MPKRTRVVAHLELDALETRYRQAHDPVARSHFQIVWLLAQGKTRTDVASVTGYSERWIGEIVRRYNAQGPDASVIGAMTIRWTDDPEWRTTGTSLGGVTWTRSRRRAVDWSEGGRLDRSGDRTSRVSATGLDLSGAFWSALETSAATAHQGQCRGIGCLPKRLSRAVDAVRAARPGTTVEVWAQDEHRIGLKAVQRRVWLLPDMEPIAPVWPRYKWCYVVAWVRPETGDSYWLLVPRIATDVYSQVLAEFARAQGLGAEKHIVLVVDRAGWHRSGDLMVPEGLHLVFLPAYAPELQPAERLWELLTKLLRTGSSRRSMTCSTNSASAVAPSRPAPWSWPVAPVSTGGRVSLCTAGK